MVSPLALASGALSLGGQLFGGLFGGGDDTRMPDLPRRTAIQSPGFSLTSGLEDGEFRTSLTRTGSPGQTAFGQRFPRALGDIDMLRGMVRPAFGQLTNARLQQIANRERRELGNLREAFRRRGLAGSTFAADAQIRAAREFAEQAAEQSALGTLQELEATANLINQEQGLIADALQRDIQLLGISSKVGTQMQDVLSRNAFRMQEIAANEAAGRGEFVGGLFGTGAGILENLNQERIENQRLAQTLTALGTPRLPGGIRNLGGP